MRNKLSLVAIAPLLVGCGVAGAAQLANGAGTEGSDVEAKANAVFTLITGDALQREAARFLEFKEVNAPFVECMAVEGFEVQPKFLPIWTGYTPNATSGSWMGALGRVPSITAMQNATSARAELNPGPQDEEITSAPYQGAVEKCRHPVALDLGHQTGVPDGSEELTSEFKKVIFDIDDQLGSIDEYNECMADSGIDLYAESDSQGWQRLYNKLVGIMPLPPLKDEKASPEWQRYLEVESDAILADSRCRETKYKEGLALLEKGLAEFEVKHAAQIDTIGEAWSNTVVQAREQGFDE